MTTGFGGPTDVACQTFQPWYWSVHDTDLSIRQAKEHNAAFNALCGAAIRAGR